MLMRPLWGQIKAPSSLRAVGPMGWRLGGDSLLLHRQNILTGLTGSAGLFLSCLSEKKVGQKDTLTILDILSEINWGASCSNILSYIYRGSDTKLNKSSGRRAF